jgi:hypothetical protein
MEHGALINYDLQMTNDEWASDCLGGFHGVRNEKGSGHGAWSID